MKHELRARFKSVDRTVLPNGFWLFMRVNDDSPQFKSTENSFFSLSLSLFLCVLINCNYYIYISGILSRSVNIAPEQSGEKQRHFMEKMDDGLYNLTVVALTKRNQEFQCFYATTEAIH